MTTYITFNDSERPLHILNFVLIQSFETDVKQHLRSYQGFQDADIIANPTFIAFSNNTQDQATGIRLHSSDEIPDDTDSFLVNGNQHNTIKTITSTRGDACDIVWNFNHFTRFTDAQIRTGGTNQNKVLNNYVIFLTNFKSLFNNINATFGLGADSDFNAFMNTIKFKNSQNIEDQDTTQPFFICNFFKNIQTNQVDTVTNVHGEKQESYRTFISNARNINTNIEGAIVFRTIDNIKSIVNSKRNGNVTDRVRREPGRNYGFLQNKLGNTATDTLVQRINQLKIDTRYQNYTVMDKIITKILCITFTSGVNPTDARPSACAIVGPVNNIAIGDNLVIPVVTGIQIVEESKFGGLNQDLFIFNKGKGNITFNGQVEIGVISTGTGTYHKTSDDDDVDTALPNDDLTMENTGTCNYLAIKITNPPDNATVIDLPQGVVLFNGSENPMTVRNDSGNVINSIVIPNYGTKVNGPTIVPTNHFLYLKQGARISLPANTNDEPNIYLEVILPPDNNANTIIPFINKSGDAIPNDQIVPTDGGGGVGGDIANDAESGVIRKFRYMNNAASGNILFPAKTIFIGCANLNKSTITFTESCRIAYGERNRLDALLTDNVRAPNLINLRNAYPEIPL